MPPCPEFSRALRSASEAWAVLRVEERWVVDWDSTVGWERREVEEVKPSLGWRVVGS